MVNRDHGVRWHVEQCRPAGALILALARVRCAIAQDMHIKFAPNRGRFAAAAGYNLLWRAGLDRMKALRDDFTLH